jgi:hypothetical protein
MGTMWRSVSRWNKLSRYKRRSIVAWMRFMTAYGEINSLTLNQRVQGSSPCAPTIEVNKYRSLAIFLASREGPVVGRGDCRADAQDRG